MTDCQRPARTNKIAAPLLFVAVAGAPLLFGSFEPQFSALWCLVLGLCALTLSTKHLRAGHLAVLAGILFVILCYAFVLHEQLAEVPWIASYHPIWAKTGDLLGVAVKPSVSIVRGQPFWALGAPLAAILALICGLVVGAERARARQLLAVIEWSGAVYAAYGIFALLFDPTAILWREKTAYFGSLTSTFINRNTAAAYLGSCGVVWFTLMLEQMRRHLPRGRIEWRGAPRHLLAEPPPSLVLSFAMMFLCLAAMFMTTSRAGVLLSLLALIVAVLVFFRNDLPRRTGLLAVAVGAAAFAWILLQFMGGNVESRIDQLGLSDTGRIEAYKSTIRMIADHPWFGTGLGTFPWAFPPYRSSSVSMWGAWDIAHSTPLELAAEMGLPFASVIAVGWLIILFVLIRGIRARRRDVIVPLSAFCVTIIALLHSCVDFSLQIPGYAIVVFALIGAGLAQSFRSGEGGADRYVKSAECQGEEPIRGEASGHESPGK